MAVVGVIGLAAIALASVVLSADDGGPIKTDAPKMATTKARLGQVAARFERITIASATAGDISVHGCTTDSGDLFQPSAEAGWKPPKARQAQAMDEAAERLAADGWVVKGASGSDEREISMTSSQGWTATGYLFSYQNLPDEPPMVAVDVHIENAEPCTQ